MPISPRIRYIRRWIWAIGVLITLLFSLVLIYIFRNPDSFLGQVELKTVDLRFQLRGEKTTDPRIVICAIDQRAIDTFGRWPWPRRQLADLLDRIAQAGPRVVALDIAFPHPQSDPLDTLVSRMDFLTDEIKNSDSFRELLLDQRQDERLAESIQKAKRLILGYFFLMTEEEAAHIPPEAMERAEGLLARYSFPVVSQDVAGVAETVPVAFGAEPNIPILAHAAAGAGFFNVMADADGTQRHKSLIVRFGDLYYPSLELETLRIFFGDARGAMKLHLSDFGVASLSLGNKRIDVDEKGGILINFKGPARTYPTLSIVEVEDPDFARNALQDKIVLIGATAPGIFDETVTPFSRQGHPGVEVRATALDNLLNNDYLFLPAWMRLVDLLLIFLIPLFFTFLLTRLRPLGGILAFVMLILWVVAFGHVAFSKYNLVFAMMPMLFSLAFIFTGATAAYLVHEGRIRKQIRGAFRRYLPPQIVDRISEEPELAALGGSEIEGTVLFCDIVGFTKIASRLSPAETVQVLNHFHSAMVEVVFESGGTLDKFIGDGVMAFWGAPLADPDHGKNGCRCALMMIRKLRQLNDVFASQNLPPLSIRIGINSGPMIVGNIGGKTRFDYTAIGDTVNRAQRLEQQCRKVLLPVLVGDRTRELAGSLFDFRYVADLVLVEGTPAAPVFTLREPASAGNARSSLYKER